MAKHSKRYMKYLLVDKATCSIIFRTMTAKEIMTELGITKFTKFYNLLMYQQLYEDYYVIEDE